MLVSEQTTAINTTLRCCLCSDKQKVSFVSRSMKDFKNTRPGKALFFAYVFPLKQRVNQRKKNTGQCLPNKNKRVCPGGYSGIIISDGDVQMRRNC